jgi:hypothetical protein
MKRGDRMFAQPSLDDFTARIDWHLNKALACGQQGVESIERKSNAEGWYRSGARIKRVVETALAEFDKGVVAALGELKRVTLLGVLDMWELRRITYDRLQDFAVRMRTVTKPEQLKELGPVKTIDQMLSEFDGRLTFALRQFDVGFEDPPMPEEPQVTSNSIQIETMIGGGIQQGTHGTSQVLTHINVPAAQHAIEGLEVELSQSTSTPIVVELKADLATVKAQLSKSSPSHSILAEATKSLRNVAEGILAGAMTNRTVQLATDLLRALGLG